jgi:hypothetical protein
MNRFDSLFQDISLWIANGFLVTGLKKQEENKIFSLIKMAKSKKSSNRKRINVLGSLELPDGSKWLKVESASNQTVMRKEFAEVVDNSEPQLRRNIVGNTGSGVEGIEEKNFTWMSFDEFLRQN